MKRTNPYITVKNGPMAQNETEALNLKSPWFKKPEALLKINRLFYAGVLLMTLFVITQSACTKKEVTVVPVVTITALNKTLLGIGDTLIITGSNFNTSPSKNLVSVASITYKVIKASGTQLSVIVPQGAQDGLVTIGFDEGQSTTFNMPVSIIGSTQPFIKSISPATAYEGDTIAVKGGNFAIPYNYNSLTISGIAAQILNVSDSVMKVIVPSLAQSGPIQITSKGANSIPFQYTISKVDPNADGHIYWMNLVYSQNAVYNQVQSEAIIDKGLTNTALPETAAFYDYKGALVPGDNTDYFYYSSFYPQNVTTDNVVVNDAQNNAYYLTATAFTVPTQYSLMRVNPAGGAPSTVWTQNFPAPGTVTNYVSAPGNPPTPVSDLPVEQISMDGSTVYIKIGITDNYYVGDVSAATPTLTLKQNVFGDPTVYRPLFGTNYIFFEQIGPYDPSYDTSPDWITGIRYMARGSKTSMPVPFTLQSTESLITILADPSHGDNLLIITSNYDANNIYFTTIYKFNAATRQVTTLYGRNNWKDSTPGTAYGTPTTTGFAWFGTHIYYSSTGTSTLFNSLYRLNDNGITPKIYTVYGQLEPNGQSQKSQFYFFLGK